MLGALEASLVYKRHWLLGMGLKADYTHQAHGGVKSYIFFTAKVHKPTYLMHPLLLLGVCLFV